MHLNVRWLASLVVILAGSLYSAYAFSKPLFPVENVPELRPIYTFSSGTFSYDVGTGVLRAVSGQAFNTGILLGEKRVQGTGTFSFEAVIDENGTVKSGSAVWTGNITPLAIPDDTIFLRGTITDVALFDASPFTGFPTIDPMLQMVISVDEPDPALGLVSSKIGFQHLVPDLSKPSGVTMESFLQSPFKSSFGLRATSFGDLFTALQPSIVLLLIIGLAILVIGRRSRESHQ